MKHKNLLSHKNMGKKLCINNLKYYKDFFYVQVEVYQKNHKNKILAFTFCKASSKNQKNIWNQYYLYFLRYWVVCVINYCLFCDDINFEINRGFVIRSFFYIIKKSGQKCKYPKNDKSFQHRIKIFLIIFEEFFHKMLFCSALFQHLWTNLLT